jgi:pyruvate kinase
MNVARINLAHGEPEEHAARARLVRSISHSLRKPIGILFDLPGPKIRVGKLYPDPISLKEGDIIILSSHRSIGNRRVIKVSHPAVLQKLKRGDSVYLADGTIRLKVQASSAKEVACRVTRGGNLFSGKGVNLPGKKLGLRALTSRDVRLLRLAVGRGADFIGVSFSTFGSDIVRAKRLVRQSGSRAEVIAKIETRQAVENFDDIVREADGVMVARGDLGVETDVEEIPVLQKQLIAKANAAARPVITATQMLDSMVANPIPTRAEVTDIANAIIDGTDAVMLSEETAVGRFPVEAVEVMRRVAAVTEANLPYRDFLDNRRSLVKKIQDAISFSACEVAYELNARCIVAHTRTGTTAHRVSKFRSSVPIIALTHSESVMNRLSLLWGLYPHRVKRLSTTREIFKAAKTEARATGMANAGDRIVVVCGDPSTPGGTTDLMRIQTV